ncbi:hypothetical protein QJS04_geneDACA011096 [Acorus gramineus]|uniref:Uncharacterized protein n=1 Tax=Acorus gramineus TaxID=55184 RepID=A0AAV9BJN9_ACOGR|nr:hypothetical protein QJS04_geneDACA011096 [Acorus gramineus]
MEKQQQQLRRPSKISRSLNKLLRVVSFLRPKPAADLPFLVGPPPYYYYEAYKRPGNLATIPEAAAATEKGIDSATASPELGVRKITVAESFTGSAAVVGISCA